MVRQTPAAFPKLREDAFVCLCLIQLSKNLGPAPGGTSERSRAACAFEKRPDNKKPGVERRARPSTQDGPARCSTVFLSGIRNQPHLVGLETGPWPHTCTSQVLQPSRSIANVTAASSPLVPPFAVCPVQKSAPVDFPVPAKSHYSGKPSRGRPGVIFSAFL